MDDACRRSSLSINHQGTVPGGHPISFNLAPGVALGQATTAIQNAEAEMGAPATIDGNFQGTAQAFQASLATVPFWSRPRSSSSTSSSACSMRATSIR